MKIEDIQDHEDEGVLSFPLDRRGRKLLKPGAFDGLRLNIHYEIIDGAPGSGASSNGYETPASMPSLSESSLLDHQVREVMQRNLRAASERNFRRTPGASSISDRSTSPDSNASNNNDEDIVEYPLSSGGFRRFQAHETQRSQFYFNYE